MAVSSAGLYTNSLQTDNHASTSSLIFLQARYSSWHSTNSVKALKTIVIPWKAPFIHLVPVFSVT